SNHNGNGLFACCASRMVSPVISGTFTDPLSSTLPAMSTVPVNDCSSTLSLNAADDKTNGRGAASAVFGLCEASSVSRLYSASDNVTVPDEVGAGTTTSVREFRVCADALPARTKKSMIVRFIARLSFGRVGNQVRQLESGSHWSIQTSRKWMVQSAGTLRATEDCAKV